MSGITEPQRQQMRSFIVQYLNRLTGQHQQNLQTPAHQIEDEIFRKCKTVSDYQHIAAKQLHEVKRKLAKQQAQQQAQQQTHAQVQASQVPMAAPKHPPHAALNPTPHMSGQQFPHDPLAGAAAPPSGMPYFQGAQHPPAPTPPGQGHAPPPPPQPAFTPTANRAPVRLYPKPEIRHVSLGFQSSFNRGDVPYGGHQVQQQVQHHSQAQTNAPFVRDIAVSHVAPSSVTNPPPQVLSSFGFPQGGPWVQQFSPSATTQMMGMTSGFAQGNPMADATQFPGVSHQQMHANRNVGMSPPAGNMEHMQQMPGAYQTPPAGMGMSGIRPTMTPSITPVPNLVQHSQPVVQPVTPNPIAANAMANPMALYQQPVYNAMCVNPTPTQAKPGFIPSAVAPVQPAQVPQVPQAPQPPTMPDAGHQLDSLSPEVLVDLFMKKSAELNVKYHRELKNALAFMQKFHEPRRDVQWEKVLEYGRTWMILITANERTKFTSKITPDLYRVLCSLETRIPNLLRQVSSRMRHRRDPRPPAAQSIPTTPQQLQLQQQQQQQQQPQQQQQQQLVTPAPQQQQHLAPAGAPLAAAPYTVSAWQGDQKPGGAAAMRAAESSKTGGQSQAGVAPMVPIDMQMDSNSDGVHKIGSDRLATSNPAKALVSILQQMPPSKMLQTKQDFQHITTAHPLPPPNPPEGFFDFVSSPSDELSVRPLTVQSQKTGCFEIDVSEGEGAGEGEGSDVGQSEGSDDSEEGSDSEQHEEHWLDLEEERARIQAAMGDDVRVKGESPKGMPGLARGILVVDWRSKSSSERGGEEKEEEGDEAGVEGREEDEKGSPKSSCEFVTVGWKRLRLTIGGEEGPSACFSSMDKSYNSPRNVSARSLFKSKLEQIEGGSVTDLVETWNECCTEVENLGKNKRKRDEIEKSQ